MSNPLVSVIVPVYNVEKYLRKCLDSLINQTYTNIEIICFNDASTDRSLDILKEYETRDNRIKVINSTINIKQGGGRNRGIRESKGELICFVDSDDWVDSKFVEVLYNALKNAEADIATSDYFEVTGDKCRKTSELGVNIQCSQNELKKAILLKGCRLYTSIFKKDLFTKNNLFFPEGVIYEDNAISGALFLQAAKICKTDHNLYYYRYNPRSCTRKKNNPAIWDRLPTSLLALENMRKVDEANEFRDEIEYRFISLYLINTVQMLLTNFSPIPYDRIKELFSDINNRLPNWRKNPYISNSRQLLRLKIFLFEKIPGVFPIMSSILKQIKKPQ